MPNSAMKLSTEVTLKLPSEAIWIFGSYQLLFINTIILEIVTAVDFNDWRASLNDYGRIVRGGQENHIIKSLFGHKLKFLLKF